VGASAMCSTTSWLVSSRATRLITSVTTTLMSSGVFSMPVFLASARTRRITSLARLLSSTIHSTERRAAPRSAGVRSSQLRQASALVTMAASG